MPMSAQPSRSTRRISIMRCPIIVGAGPSGLAVAASLGRLSVPSIILERSDGIADLWCHRTYDRLNLHLPKPFCQLPHLPFPAHLPTYPSKDHFLDYLHRYADHFSLRPLFGCTVTDARFDEAASLWRVTSSRSPSSSSSEPLTEPRELEVVEFASPWLVVATGENAEPVVPEIKGAQAFMGSLLHSSEYKSGVEYRGKRVLVIGCGNSGMEICVDLCDHGAMPFMSVRSGVHVLPREMLGTSTFGVAMRLLKWLPTRVVDRFLLIMAKMIIGDTEKYGLKRPKMGPLELKNKTGKTPVLDVGALSLIKAGKIKTVQEVRSLTSNGAKFVDGEEMAFDSVVFATGYKTNVPFWLKEDTDLFSAEGKPKLPFPNGCSGENGIYFVGFTGKGLLGASADAIEAALRISQRWTSLSKNRDLVL
ncbi:indole-3-pyruvate monooxygenase YUCCA8-like [Musa acuminata AAA Group]|uniref:indole-3-pyruvate monooxygenase YUCCA8-like n=1 Tax=Musa acuminata AAA Group TaxID=214697 RepID=UPI0031DE3B93